MQFRIHVSFSFGDFMFSLSALYSSGEGKNKSRKFSSPKIEVRKTCIVVATPWDQLH